MSQKSWIRTGKRSEQDVKSGQRNGAASLQEINSTVLLAAKKVTLERGRQPLSAGTIGNRRQFSALLPVQAHEGNQWVRSFRAQPKVILQKSMGSVNSLPQELEGDKGLHAFKDSSEKSVKGW